MFVYSEIQPHLIFLIIVLVLSWSLATWLNWQNRKMHCELVPQFVWVSRYGLFTGTVLMIFNLWFLSLFYDELKLGMTIIFAAIMVGIGSYLARFFEWLVFFQEIEVGFWRKTITNYYFKEYGNGLGPKGSEKKGISNCVALAKNASATTSTIKPVRRSDITSLHRAQQTWL